MGNSLNNICDTDKQKKILQKNLKWKNSIRTALTLNKPKKYKNLMILLSNNSANNYTFLNVLQFSKSTVI